MRQLQFSGYGPLKEVLQFSEVETPEVGDHDVRIRIAAASINPIDYKMVSGALRQIQKLKLPSPLGFDCCGEVDAVGSAVTRFRVGDRVYTRLPRGRVGSFAELTIVDEKFVAPAPSGLTAVECASLPLVSLTTMQGLVDRAEAQPSQTILIHAGSGGVGSIAVQYAKNVLGLHVTTTASSRNVDWVRELGADEVIPYDSKNYLGDPIRYDIVYDTLGGKTTYDSFNVVKRGGKVVSIMGPPGMEFARQMGVGPILTFAIWMMGRKIRKLAKEKPARYFYYFTESSGAQLEHMAKVVEDGKVRPVIDSVFPFEKAIDALEHAHEGHTRGKVVIQMLPE
ncbi:MAG: NADP-dependent oxidoreductase [Acidiferrobacterales bacterium]|nr:NADP-dependent oxidoreductase [Acidiferrobacterales bacterium]